MSKRDSTQCDILAMAERSRKLVDRNPVTMWVSWAYVAMYQSTGTEWEGR